MPGSQCRLHGDEAAVPAHEFHQADGVVLALGLDVRGIDGLLRLRDCRVEAEGPVKHHDVVVDRLGDTDDRALVRAALELLHCVKGLHASLVRAIAAEDEVLLDVHGLEVFGDLRVGRVTAVAHQDAAAELMNLLHGFGRQLHPLLWGDETLVAALATVDVLHAVCMQHHDQLADHRVQPGAQASTIHNASRRGRRVEMEELSRTSHDHLVVDVELVFAFVELLQSRSRPRVRADKSSRAHRIRNHRGREHAAQVSDLHPPHLVANAQHGVDAGLRREEVEDVHGAAAG
mmetsp:Transcript_10108/g.27242  ORF Transcript_10108/g.27242 Transcript_10108/m.27242 type:complete len:289 (+) Transcript_10108:500-1366(+)